MFVDSEEECSTKVSSIFEFLGTCLSDGRFSNTSRSPHPIHRRGWVDGFGDPICDVSDILFPSTWEATAIVMVLRIKSSSFIGSIKEDIDT